MAMQEPTQLYRILPPYESIGRVARGDYAAPPGTVLGIPLTPDSSLSALRNQVRTITREAPAAALIGIFSTEDLDLETRLAVTSASAEAGLQIISRREDIRASWSTRSPGRRISIARFASGCGTRSACRTSGSSSS
jgi:hypothetical protein